MNMHIIIPFFKFQTIQNLINKFINIFINYNLSKSNIIIETLSTKVIRKKKLTSVYQISISNLIIMENNFRKIMKI